MDLLQTKIEKKNVVRDVKALVFDKYACATTCVHMRHNLSTDSFNAVLPITTSTNQQKFTPMLTPTNRHLGEPPLRHQLCPSHIYSVLVSNRLGGKRNRLFLN